MLDEEIADVPGDGMQAGFVDLQDEGDIVLEADQAALEIGDRNAGVRVPDVQADEIAGLGVQAVNARPAPAGGAGFAQLDHETFVHEFADQLGDRGNAGVNLLTQSCNAIFTTLDAESEDGLLQDGILVVLFVQKCRSHLFRSFGAKIIYFL